MAADCKSAAPCELRRFESSPVHQIVLAVVAQLVERVLGKDEVTGSIPVNGSTFCSEYDEKVLKWRRKNLTAASRT
jgi:hypothetical protein